MSYFGSPRTTQEGMPMTYETARSKLRRTSAGSSASAWLSGVIQFKRPISSAGPHGLVVTTSPFGFRASGDPRASSAALMSCFVEHQSVHAEAVEPADVLDVLVPAHDRFPLRA